MTLAGEIEAPPAGKHVMAVLDPSGDTKVIWDPSNPDEVANAKRTFEDLTKKGYRAYRVSPEDAGRGEQVRRFDPEAEKMILAPPLQGG